MDLSKAGPYAASLVSTGKVALEFAFYIIVSTKSAFKFMKNWDKNNQLTLIGGEATSIQLGLFEHRCHFVPLSWHLEELEEVRTHQQVDCFTYKVRVVLALPYSFLFVKQRA